MYGRTLHSVFILTAGIIRSECNVKFVFCKQRRRNWLFSTLQILTRGVSYTNKMPKKEKTLGIVQWLSCRIWAKCKCFQDGTPVHHMPSRNPGESKSTPKQQQQPETPTGPVSILKDGALTIAIHAKPGAKQNAITDVSPEAVGVAIAAPPTDGEANAELVRYLCKVLELKRSEITLDKGSKSREKVIKVTAPISQEDVLKKLMQEASS